MEVKGCGCVSNAQVYGLKESIRRAKFPMAVDVDALTAELTNGIKKLAQSRTGEGHDNWLNGVVVQFDLKFSIKAWIELERYHFFDFVSSQSTMHRITRFDQEEVYNKYVDPRIVEILQEKIKEYNRMVGSGYMQETLNKKYLEILYSNPAGFTYTAGMTTNYRQLKTVYQQRRNHRLPEWREFCRWIETLPCAELITNGNTQEESENGKGRTGV